MNIHPTAIRGMAAVAIPIHEDERGVFSRIYCSELLEDVMSSRTIVQINHSCTRHVGALRGLHFQHAPHAEMKLVRCIRGRVWDVAVDLRAGSDTFLQWHAEALVPGRMLVIPEGCAHGFQVLEPDSEMLYLHTAPYTPHAEGGIRYDDPRLGISWPLPVTEVSQRDRSHPLLPSDFTGFDI